MAELYIKYVNLVILYNYYFLIEKKNSIPQKPMILKQVTGFCQMEEYQIYFKNAFNPAIANPLKTSVIKLSLLR